MKLLVSVATLATMLQAASANFVVAAYLPEYRWYIDVEAAVNCCLTDLILFSVR
jgi:hypothetical protein